MKIDYANKPVESLETLLDRYHDDMYLIMDDVLASKKSYVYIYQQMIDIMKLGFEVEEIRHRMIHYKFHAEDSTVYQLTIPNFISNLIVWYAFMEMDKVEILNESYIFDFKQFTMDKLVSFLENEVLVLFEGDFHSKNKIVDEIFHNIRAIANAFCMLMGMGISIYDIWQAEKQSPEIHDILYGTIDPSLQPIEIEEELNRRTDRLIELFSEIDCDLKPLLVSGKNLSKGQFREMFVLVALKSDINGATIPYPVLSNLVVGGLHKPSYQYIEAGSARKSVIFQKQKMGDPGAFSKKINLEATSPAYPREDFEECNSIGFISYHIKDEGMLKLLDNRYYYDQTGSLKELRYPRDTHLIGKVINFTSPCTCNSKEGICKKCYGGLFDMNQELFSVGSFAATKASNPLGQRVLGTKHHQGTESTTITFNDDFNDIFELNSTEITLSDNPKNDDELYILLDEVFVEQNDDADYYYVKQFRVVDRKGNTVYTIADENGSNIYMSDMMRAIYRKLKVKNTPIPIDSLVDDDTPLFQVEIKNKEVTEPIKMLNKLLGKQTTENRSLSEVCQMLAEAFIDIDIRINLVHLECILKGLIRKKSNIYEYPDWSRNGDPNDYMVMPMNSGLRNNPSPLVSLTYGYIRQQLVSPELYEKDAPSHLDALFVRNLNQYME